MSLSTLDLVILVGYLLAMAVIGFAASRRVRDTEGYFLGHRRFGPWLMIGQSFGIGTHAEMPVALAGAVYSVGLSGIWYQWKNLFATPFYWLMAPVFRRVRRTTMAEMCEDRYGSAMGILYAAFALGFFTINTAAMLKGAAKVVDQALGGQAGVEVIVIAMTVLFVAYSFVGGLVASAWTDFFQGFLIIALSFMLVPRGWAAVGGLAGLRATLEPHCLSISTPQGVGPFVILVLTLNGLIGIMAQPHMLAAVGTGRNELACRMGFMGGNLVKRACTIGWAMVGLIVAAMVAQGQAGTRGLADPEDAFGFACRHLLFPGGLGLLIASVLAANMSTSSALMVDSGALFTQNLYRRLVPERDDRHYLLAGRIGGFAITMLGVLYALFLVDRVLYAFLLTETLATYVGVSFVGGIVWRRANRYGAFASVLAALATNFAAYHLRHQRLDHWDPSVFLLSLVSGVVALVVVSLVTSREPASVEGFFRRLNAPSDTEPPAASTIDGVARQGKQSLLVNLFSIRRASAGCGWRAYREDLIGFFAGWIIVAGLVGGLAALF